MFIIHGLAQGFIQAPFGGETSPPNFGTSPPRRFGQVYSYIKNPVIAVIQRAAVIQM